METKLQNIKSKRPKNYSEMCLTEKVAHSVGCSTRMVRYILEGKRNQETEMAQKILIAAAVIEERENRLLDEIKRIVKL